MQRLALPEHSENDATSSRTVSLSRPQLDQKLITRICDLAQKGLPLDAICDYLGIFANDMRQWIQKGERFFRTESTDYDQQIFGELFRQLRRAMAEFRMRHIEGLNDKGTWFKSINILERIDRKTFSKFDRYDQSTEVADPDERFL